MSTQGQTVQDPTLITLDNTNSINILAKYIELAQQKGAYLLSEAELLKRAIDVLINNVPDNEINEPTSKNLLIQGVNKGQQHGSYTLNDASLLSKVVQFVEKSDPRLKQMQQQQQPQQPPQPPQQQQQSPQSSQILNDVDDLSDLAEPIPLKPKEV